MTYLDELTDYQNSNFLFLTANVAIWSSVEQGLAITAGSLATLRPLIIKIGRKLGFASATSASANDIEFGPIGPPVLLRERTNSMFSRRGPSKPRGSNAVLLETETAVPLNGAHVSPGSRGRRRKPERGMKLTRILMSSTPDTLSLRDPSTKICLSKDIVVRRILHLRGP